MFRRVAPLMVTLLLVAHAPAAWGGERISTVLGPDEEVGDFVIAPDSSQVVYEVVSWATGSRTGSLYSVPVNGDASTELHGGPVQELFEIAPDSSRVVFATEVGGVGPLDLSSVPIRGGPSVTLDACARWAFSEFGDTCRFSITPDSSRVVYLGHDDPVNSTNVGLFSVPTAGGDRIRLSGLQSVGVYDDFAVSPDSSTVVFVSQRTPDSSRDLYAMPVSGGTAVRLTRTTGPDRGIYPLAISDDSRWVVFAADLDGDSLEDFYSVPIGGGTPRNLSQGLLPGGLTYDFSLSQDSSRVVFSVESPTTGFNSLYSVSIAGGQVSRLGGSAASGGSVSRFLISPDSRRVVYDLNQQTLGRAELFSDATIGGEPVKLSGSLVLEEFGIRIIDIASESNVVTFRVSHDVDATQGVYSVPLSGGEPVKVSHPLPPGGVLGYATDVTSDGWWIVYSAADSPGSVHQVWVVSPAGGPASQVSNSLRVPEVFDEPVSLRWKLTGDSARLVYRAAEDSRDVLELFVAELRPYTDVAMRHTFFGDIAWLEGEGITKGCNPPANDKFCPDNHVTRGQMAALLSRALHLPASTRDYFVDDAESIFEGDINRIAEAGITKGCNPAEGNTRFCPNSPVTRGQMAAFLVRALNYEDAGAGDLFIDDDDSIFEADVDRLATAGVTRGCNPPSNTLFCPTEYVTRGEMAAFLHRALG